MQAEDVVSCQHGGWLTSAAPRRRARAPSAASATRPAAAWSTLAADCCASPAFAIASRTAAAASRAAGLLELRRKRLHDLARAIDACRRPCRSSVRPGPRGRRTARRGPRPAPPALGVAQLRAPRPSGPTHPRGTRPPRRPRPRSTAEQSQLRLVHRRSSGAAPARAICHLCTAGAGSQPTCTRAASAETETRGRDARGAARRLECRAEAAVSSRRKRRRTGFSSPSSGRTRPTGW